MKPTEKLRSPRHGSRGTNDAWAFRSGEASAAKGSVGRSWFADGLSSAQVLRRMANICSIPFGARRIGRDAPVLVIAEIGINHEGDAEVCARMIEAAAAAGADAIKLQTVDASKNYGPDTESYRIFSSAELSQEETAQAFSQARALGMEAFTTVGDLATLEWVGRLNPSGYKISSGLLTCTPLIAAAAKLQGPVLMSTGMADVDDIDRAVNVARVAYAKRIALFQCTSLYPAPFDALEIGAIGWLAERYAVPVGFSDHSVGTEASVLATAAGATMIEKHFSLDPQRAGYDHALSLHPADFRRMVDGVRRAEAARGSGVKRATPEMLMQRRKMSRYLGVVVPVMAGEILNEGNLGFLRLSDSADALPASAFDEVVGARSTRDLPPFAHLSKTSYRHD